MEPSKIILCPGQGAQVVGMAKAWCDRSPEARAVFAEGDAAWATRPDAKSGEPALSEICFNGPVDRLNQTDVSQPAIYVASVACWRGLLAAWGFGNGESGLAAAAGLSLGEYTALHVAGAIAFRDGLDLVILRGRAMQDAAEAAPSGMVALIGADEAQARKVCDEARGSGVLVCANFNAPGQVVLSGDKGACERVAHAASAMGLRAAPLPVSGAFHSPLMKPAADRLATALAKTTIRDPRCPVYSNVTARPHEKCTHADLAGSIRARLVEQLTSPVRWAQSCVAMASAHAGAAWHELAPGRTLSGLMRRIDRNIKVETHEEP